MNNLPPHPSEVLEFDKSTSTSFVQDDFFINPKSGELYEDSSCSFPNCHNTGLLFPFPINYEYQLIWSNFCRKRSCSATDYLCGDHFAADAYEDDQIQLAETAIPTISNDEGLTNPFELNNICQLCASYDINTDLLMSESIKVLALTDDIEMRACEECTLIIEKWLLFYKKCKRAQKLLSVMVEANHKYLEYQTNKTESAEDNQSCEQDAVDFHSFSDEEQDEEYEKLVPAIKKKKRPPHVKVTRCLDCDKDFGNNGKLRTHRKVCPLKDSQLSKKNGPFACPICDRIFKTSVGYNVHRHSHEKPKPEGVTPKSNARKTKKEPFICHLCGKSSALKTGLEQHLKFHFKIKDFICTSCPKAFYTKSDLQHHLFTHTGLRSFVCMVCQKTFASRKHLLKHIKIHDASRRKIQCPHCPKKFFVPFELRVHMVKHTGLRHNVCNICSLDFRYSHELRAHIENVHPKSCGEVVMEDASMEIG